MAVILPQDSKTQCKHLITVICILFAFRAGLRPGDIITKMNDKDTESSKQVYQHVRKGEALKIEVKRGELYLKFTVQPEVVG